jgi:hypothetical protein
MHPDTQVPHWRAKVPASEFYHGSAVSVAALTMMYSDVACHVRHHKGGDHDPTPPQGCARARLRLPTYPSGGVIVSQCPLTRATSVLLPQCCRQCSPSPELRRATRVGPACRERAAPVACFVRIIVTNTVCLTGSSVIHAVARWSHCLVSDTLHTTPASGALPTPVRHA